MNANPRTGATQEVTPRAPRTDVGKFVALGAILTAVGFLTSLIRSKVVAVRIGPEGVGVLGEAMQMASIAMLGASLAASPALTAAVGRAHGAEDLPGIRRAVSSSATLALILGVPGMLIMILVSGWVPHGTSWPMSIFAAVALASVGGLLGAVQSVIVTSMAGIGQAARTARVTVGAGVAGTAVMISLAWPFGTAGALLSLPVTGAIGVALALWSARSARNGEPILAGLQLDRVHVKACLALGTASLLGMVVQQAGIAGVRLALLHVGGPQRGAELNGYFQAAIGIEGQFLNVAMYGLLTFFWPRFAAAKKPQELASLINQISGYLLGWLPGIVIVAVLLRDEAIRLLFSARFLPTGDVLMWTLPAVFPKAVAYVYGGPLLYHARARTVALVTVCGSLISGIGAATAVLLTGRLEMLGAAQFIAGMIHLVITVSVSHASVGTPLQGKLLLAAGAVPALALGLAAATSGLPWARYTCAAIIVGGIVVTQRSALRNAFHQVADRFSRRGGSRPERSSDD